MPVKHESKVARMSGRCAAINRRPRVCPYVHGATADNPRRLAWLEGYDQAVAEQSNQPEDTHAR